MSSLSPAVATLNVAIGGAVGAALRYQLGRAMTHWLGIAAIDRFPWATLAANAIGCLAMGLLAGWLARHGSGGPFGGEQARLLLGVGLLGGFTTFSSFGLEMMLLTERGQPSMALIYAVVSVVAGFAGLWTGLHAMRIFG